VANQKDPKPVYLAGYSRGGACVMQVAKFCARWSGVTTIRGGDFVNNIPIPIQAMFLLDPVSWDLCRGKGVPNNVAHSYVMYRDRGCIEFDAPVNASDWDHWLDQTAAVYLFDDTDPDRYARKFMGNCMVNREEGNRSTTFHNAGTIQDGSHGAVGGVPWVERRKDEAAARKAADTLTGWVKECGISVKIADNSYTEENKRKYPAKTDEMIRKYMAREKAAADRNARAKAEAYRKNLEKLQQEIRINKWR
jgi:hypothetical protein